MPQNKFIIKSDRDSILFNISDSFQCTNGDLISSHWVCDAENDCLSGEDEQNCGNTENVASHTTTGL